ncbi:MAG: DUF6151 family protein [Pseudomonadota bacterium]
MSHDLETSCRCGKVQYRIVNATPEKFLGRGVCYCEDCQSFAHYLGDASTVLDERGGTEVFQTQPRFLEFTSGIDQLAAMRLSNRGPIRWYAKCCNSPIGNSVPTRAVAFTGLITRPGQLSAADDTAIGGEKIAIFPDLAKGGPDPALKQTSMAWLVIKNIFVAAGAFLMGRHKKTPFFTDDGRPIVDPEILNDDEREALLKKVRAA